MFLSIFGDCLAKEIARADENVIHHKTPYTQHMRLANMGDLFRAEDRAGHGAGTFCLFGLYLYAVGDKLFMLHCTHRFEFKRTGVQEYTFHSRLATRTRCQAARHGGAQGVHVVVWTWAGALNPKK